MRICVSALLGTVRFGKGAGGENEGGREGVSLCIYVYIYRQRVIEIGVWDGRVRVGGCALTIGSGKAFLTNK